MRVPLLAVIVIASALAAPSLAAAPLRGAKDGAKEQKTWCAPEVTELSNHVCYAAGGAQGNGRRTLVVYLHGALAPRHGFAYMQQRMMAQQAALHSFTVLMPTASWCSPAARRGCSAAT